MKARCFSTAVLAMALLLVVAPAALAKGASAATIAGPGLPARAPVASPAAATPAAAPATVTTARDGRAWWAGGAPRPCCC
jgi:hypothetical protein